MFDSFVKDFDEILQFLPKQKEIKLADPELLNLALAKNVSDHKRLLCVFETSSKAESCFNEFSVRGTFIRKKTARTI